MESDSLIRIWPLKPCLSILYVLFDLISVNITLSDITDIFLFSARIGKKAAFPELHLSHL